jgi:pimeloyl-ACP methyl ester carboxylesterase
MTGQTPLDAVGPLATQEVVITPELRHVEVYTLRGLLTLLWHGEPDATSAVVTGGGGMGGLLGPGDGLYHQLGLRFAEQGIATIRVGYRRPNDVGSCALDLLAAADIAGRGGTRRFVTVGHSFGGAVAIQAAIGMVEYVAGVVTLATQSAGCEEAGRLAGTPLLLIHGDQDEILPAQTSEVVRALAGAGEVVIVPGTGHLFSEYAEHLPDLVGGWIERRLEEASP